MKGVKLLVISLVSYWLYDYFKNKSQTQTTASNARVPVKIFVDSEILNVNDYNDVKFNVPGNANYVEFQPQDCNVKVRQDSDVNGGLIVYENSLASFDTYAELVNAKLRAIDGTGKVYVNYYLIS